jgi:hypothetical protein
MLMNCRVYYDPKCEELARHFLADAPGSSEADALDLAGEIQTAIENWWGVHKPPVTSWQDPTLAAPSNPLVLVPTKPPSFAVSSSGGEPIFTIHHDGAVAVNPKYATDDAALAFWEAVIRLNPFRKEKDDARH